MGRLKGRNLASPSSRDIRPTADRLRESLFNILMHAYDDPIADARVLDLFAGTGALGIEAVSRGAKFTLFVDNGAEARALLRNNVEALGLGGVTKVYRRDATNLGPAHPMEPFSLVFLDPPYRMKLAEKALASLRDGGWLTPGALLVVEEQRLRRSRRPTVSRSWSGGRMTIRSLCFCGSSSVAWAKRSVPIIAPSDCVRTVGTAQAPLPTLERDLTSSRTASRYRSASIPHRSAGRGCTGRNSACLPSRAAARSSPPA